MTELEVLKDGMNSIAFCNYCRKMTATKEWDCVECGVSKPHPDGFHLVTDISMNIASVGQFGERVNVVMEHRPTGITVEGTDQTLNQSELKTRLLRELSQRVRDANKGQEDR